MRLLLIFVGLFYVTSFSVAQGSVPSYVQPGVDRAVMLSEDDCRKHSLKNLAVSQCSLIDNSGFEDTGNNSRTGEEATVLCLFHAITMESASCMEPATQKQTPILTRRLVALHLFNIKKPPRLTS